MIIPKYLMKCGHADNATLTTGQEAIPVCAIYGCTEIEKQIENYTEGLEGRYAKCTMGEHGIVPSRWNLPFFEYRPDNKYDNYYCGCRGWD